jgi:hypothetical protein
MQNFPRSQGLGSALISRLTADSCKLTAASCKRAHRPRKNPAIASFANGGQTWSPANSQ